MPYYKTPFQKYGEVISGHSEIKKFEIPGESAILTKKKVNHFP